MNISTLNQFVETIKRYTHRLLDISTWEMISSQHEEHGHILTMVTFFGIENEISHVIKVKFIGDTVMEDSVNLMSFNSEGYRSEDEYIKEIAQCGNVGYSMVKRLLMNRK